MPPTDLLSLFQTAAISLGLGLLVGLQRESRGSALAGIRTFPLVTLAGTLCAWLSVTSGGVIVAAGLLAIAGLLLVGSFVSTRAQDSGGLTTEVALLFMYLVGAYLALGVTAIGIVLGGLCAILLQFKRELHGAVHRLGERDLVAIMQLVLLALVILPVLPNRGYGPYAVLNPKEIWFMVTLIVGIGLAAYTCYKFVGDRAGTLLAGLLGGMVSSTATTISYARLAASSPGTSSLAAVAIVLASGVVFIRVLIEMAAVSRELLLASLTPMLVLCVYSLLHALLLYRQASRGEVAPPQQKNPSEVRTALMFGCMYAFVMLATAAGKDYFGQTGLYLVAVISGLTDVDAITLSTARMVQQAQLPAELGTRVVLIATLSNLLFKLALVASVAPRRLAVSVGMYVLVATVTGALLFAFAGRLSWSA